MNVIDETEQWVKDQLLNETTGHDWYHIVRVTNVAKEIGEKENADLFIVEIASLLHDLADDKVNKNGQQVITDIRYWLKNHNVDETNIEHIINIIQTISFKGGHEKRLHTLEAEIVQDADRIDALGAIGIARAFQYSGSQGQAIYDPNLFVRKHMTFEEYRNEKSSAVHHFYEKLLRLKDKMNTETGKQMARERHEFMENFLEQFYKEWYSKIELHGE